MAFKKIDEQGILPGPRAVFISGYKEDSFPILEGFLKELNILEVTLIPARADHVGLKVSEVLENTSQAELVPAEKLPPVMLWSGISHVELDTLIRRFRENRLPRPIFATTTEANMEFDIRTLIRHLLDDQKEIRQKQAERAK
ncbi:MAG: DUF3783 domain-containing protein [Spirochaetaceae bacterium]|jgi:hypothetical protein|nr:DUF3783 domain-containing protein [Spirochaetaceae bacterium]